MDFQLSESPEELISSPPNDTMPFHYAPVPISLGQVAGRLFNEDPSIDNHSLWASDSMDYGPTYDPYATLFEEQHGVLDSFANTEPPIDGCTGIKPDKGKALEDTYAADIICDEPQARNADGSVAFIMDNYIFIPSTPPDTNIDGPLAEAVKSNTETGKDANRGHNTKHQYTTMLNQSTGRKTSPLSDRLANAGDRKKVTPTNAMELIEDDYDLPKIGTIEPDYATGNPLMIDMPYPVPMLDGFTPGNILWSIENNPMNSRSIDPGVLGPVEAGVAGMNHDEMDASRKEFVFKVGLEPSLKPVGPPQVRDPHDPVQGELTLTPPPPSSPTTTSPRQRNSQMRARVTNDQSGSNKTAGEQARDRFPHEEYLSSLKLDMGSILNPRKARTPLNPGEKEAFLQLVRSGKNRAAFAMLPEDQKMVLLNTPEEIAKYRAVYPAPRNMKRTEKRLWLCRAVILVLRNAEGNPIEIERVKKLCKAQCSGDSVKRHWERTHLGM